MTPGDPTVTESLTSRVAAALAERIDRDHPRLARFLVGLRWGGLRTVQPGTGPFLAILGAGAALGVAGATRIRPGGRRPVPTVLAGPLGAALVWAGLWRWDAVRWHARNVRVVPGLPPDAVDELVERLAAEGIRVERWERSSAGGTVVGLSCRTRDLRRVNRAIDELERPGGVDGGVDTGS